MKKNDILSILGGLLGALIGTIPWVLMYVYGGYILSVLAAVIAICSLKGYMLFKGEKKKSTSLLIIICSVLAITFSTFVTIPLLLNMKYGLDFSLETLKNMYINNNFFNAILGDYAISLLFTFLGISGVVSNLKAEVSTPISIGSENEDINKILDIFKKHQAFTKTNAISNKDIAKEINLVEYNNIFQYLKKNRILIGNTRIYFDEKAYTDLEYRNKMIKKVKNKTIIIGTCLLIVCLCLITFLSSDHDYEDDLDNNQNTTEINKSDYKTHEFLNYASYQLPSYLTIYEDNTDSNFYNEYNYYSITYTPFSIYRGETVFKTVYTDYLIDYYYEDFSEYEADIYENSTDEYHAFDVILRKDINNLEMIEIKATGTEGKIYRDYYIFYNNNSLFFEFICYDSSSEEVIIQEIEKVLKSVKFIEKEEIQKF